MQRQAQRHPQRQPDPRHTARRQARAPEPVDGGLVPGRLLTHATLVSYQRSAGNAAVNTLLARARDPIQRREPSQTPPAEVAAPTAGQTPDLSAAAGGSGGGRTTTLTLNANYHEVPGKGKDRVAAREEANALWLTPALKSHVPPVMETVRTTGVVAGVGEQTVAKMPVPVTETDPSFGRGSLTAAMRFGSSLDRTFSVNVDFEDYEGKGNGKALARRYAKEFLVEKMQDVGEMSYLEGQAAEHLASKGFKNPIVTVAMRKGKRDTTEVGSSTFYYLARNNPTILMEILPEPTGEKHVSGSRTVAESAGVEHETQAAQQHAQKTTSVTHRERITEKLRDFVTKVVDYRKQVTRDLYKKLKDSRTSTGAWAKVRSSKEVVDTKPLVRELERHEEGGKKTKKNWAAKLRDKIGKVKKFVRIPIVGKYVEKIPIIGKRIRPWHLDLAEKAADLLAVEGEVDYKDITERETTSGGKKTTKGGSTEVGAKRETEDRVVTNEEQFVELVEAESREEWSRYQDKVKEIEKDYLKVEGYSAGQTSARTKVDARRATTASTSWSTTWKFTKPVVTATVIDGDGEVSAAPLTGPEGAPAKVAAPAAPKKDTAAE